MNPKIEQCKAVIAKLQEELKRLEDEPTPRHGDIVAYHGERRIIVIVEDGTPRAYDVNGHMVAGGSSDGVAYCYTSGCYTVLGNVFDWEAK